MHWPSGHHLSHDKAGPILTWLETPAMVHQVPHTVSGLFRHVGVHEGCLFEALRSRKLSNNKSTCHFAFPCPELTPSHGGTPLPSPCPRPRGRRRSPVPAGCSPGDVHLFPWKPAAPH